MPRKGPGEDDTSEGYKNLINYPKLIHKFPSNGKYLYGRSHIPLAFAFFLLAHIVTIVAHTRCGEKVLFVARDHQC